MKTVWPLVLFCMFLVYGWVWVTRNEAEITRTEYKEVRFIQGHKPYLKDFIEGFADDGVITRAEYNEILERYELEQAVVVP